MGMRLLVKTNEMMTITIVISNQMMVRVILVPSPHDNNYSLDGGIYSPNYWLWDMIWKDIDQDSIPDDGEEGVADVNITLYNSSNEELGTDTTDSGGKYEFCNLSSDDYYIVVDKSTLPDGYEITAQNQGDDDNNDSDINPDDGKSDTVTISDDNNYSLDGGIYSPIYCLWDMIWTDIDQDGIQDDGDEGVQMLIYL